MTRQPSFENCARDEAADHFCSLPLMDHTLAKGKDTTFWLEKGGPSGPSEIEINNQIWGGPIRCLELNPRLAFEGRRSDCRKQ
jgi:hypothetical protein